MFKLVLTHHTIDEWCEVMARRLRDLGCSEEYVIHYVERLRQRSGIS